MIQSLQAEKMQLMHEKMQIKRSLEEQQCGLDNSSTTTSTMLTNCEDVRVPSTKPHIMAPPKKRRKFVDDAAIAAASGLFLFFFRVTFVSYRCCNLQPSRPMRASE